MAFRVKGLLSKERERYWLRKKSLDGLRERGDGLCPEVVKVARFMPHICLKGDFVIHLIVNQILYVEVLNSLM